MEEAVERAISDRCSQDDVGERRFFERGQVDAVFRKEAVEVSAHCARERESIARGQADIAYQGQAVAKIVRQLRQVATLPRGSLHDVGAAPVRLGRVGRACPQVDELHLQQCGRRGDRGDHALALGQADLDRDSSAVGRLTLVHVGRDPFAVAETKDRLARLALLAGIGLQVRVLDRAEDHVLDVANRNPARTVEVGRRVNREAVTGQCPRVRLAALEAAVEAVHSNLAAGHLDCASLGWARG